MGPGGSLSTVLIAMLYWRDASRRVSWQAATATAVSISDRTAAALVHRLGTAGGGGEGADWFRWRRIPNLFILLDVQVIRLPIRPFFIMISVEFITDGQ
jgi:hypothetical protein